MNRYGIGKAAKLCETTAETLRHYDRIGLVSPREKDKFTKYRYYTDAEIVQLKTVRLLRCMELPLDEIRALLESEDLAFVTARLAEAEGQVRQKIERLQNAADRMRHVRGLYETLRQKQSGVVYGNLFECGFPDRTLFVSERPDAPDRSNLWQYHTFFYRDIAPEKRSFFAFSDTAAVLADDSGENRRLCAVCEKWIRDDRLYVLPSGSYLCAACPCGGEEEALKMLKEEFSRRGLSFPASWLLQVRIRGLLKWDYIAQARLQ